MKFRISKSRLGKGLVRVRGMSNDGQVNIKSQSELDIGGRETCSLKTETDRAEEEAAAGQPERVPGPR